MRVPRPYQSEAVNLLRISLQRGHRRPILQLPTGAGKTFVAAMILRMALSKSKRVLFLAPRRELIFQASKAFSSHGIHNGVIMAGERPRQSDVQVASYQTLFRRGVQDERMEMPDVDFLIVDEAHLSITDSYQKLFEHYAGKIIIGLTATPARGDGRGLGEVYDDLIAPVSIRELTDEGYLAPVRYFAPSQPDLSALKVQGGDYVKSELGGVMDKPELIGDIVQNWRRLANGKRTVVFCSTIAHGRHVCEEFNNAEIAAEHVDSETPKEERAAILERVESGKTTVVTNVFVMSYGLDIPALECAVLARPTKNISLYLQTVGRVLRTMEGKDEAIVIDHSGAIAENGFVDDFIPWSLDGRNTVKDRIQDAKERNNEPKEITCGECGTVFKGRRVCPACGFRQIAEGKPIPVHEADLEEIHRAAAALEKKANRDWSWERKVEFIGGLMAHRAEKGYAPGWVANQYREKFGVWPNDSRLKNAPAIEKNEDVRGWLKHKAIAYAATKKKRAAA